eukprot:6629952-Prymnesium_polylepis.1
MQCTVCTCALFCAVIPARLCTFVWRRAAGGAVLRARRNRTAGCGAARASAALRAPAGARRVARCAAPRDMPGRALVLEMPLRARVSALARRSSRAEP